MKQQLCVTVEKSIVEKAWKQVDGRLFRNMSHLVEYALNDWLEGRK